jgi:hypothetical protein
MASFPLTAASGLPKTSVARKGDATPPANTDVAVNAPRHKTTRAAKRECEMKRRSMDVVAPLSIKMRYPGAPAFPLACELIKCFLSADGNQRWLIVC